MTDHSPIDIFVGSQVQLHRTLMKMSRAELAATVMITGRELAAYEAGDVRFPADLLLSIADALGKKVSEFFRTVEEQLLLSVGQNSEAAQTKPQQEAALNLAFSRLSDAERAEVLAYVQRLLGEH